jgi:hypothetical protein
MTISSSQQLINLLQGRTTCRHKPTVSKHNNDKSILTLSIVDATVCSINDRQRILTLSISVEFSMLNVDILSVVRLSAVAFQKWKLNQC